ARTRRPQRPTLFPYTTLFRSLPSGPATRTSASQRIDVCSPCASRWNCVSMLTIAPTPCPFAERREYSIGRSSVFSNLNLRARLRSEEHTSELQSRGHLVCRPL